MAAPTDPMGGKGGSSADVALHLVLNGIQLFAAHKANSNRGAFKPSERSILRTQRMQNGAISYCPGASAASCSLYPAHCGVSSWLRAMPMSVLMRASSSCSPPNLTSGLRKPARSRQLAKVRGDEPAGSAARRPDE